MKPVRLLRFQRVTTVLLFDRVELWAEPRYDFRAARRPRREWPGLQRWVNIIKRDATDPLPFQLRVGRFHVDMYRDPFPSNR